MREEVALKINLPESRVQVSIKHFLSSKAQYTVELHLAGLNGTASHPDRLKIRIIRFLFDNRLHLQLAMETKKNLKTVVFTVRKCLKVVPDNWRSTVLTKLYEKSFSYSSFRALWIELQIIPASTNAQFYILCTQFLDNSCLLIK